MSGLDPVFAWVIRLALALLFGTAAWHKLRDLRAFSATLANYRLLPRAFARPVALALACCELGVASLLLVPLSGELVPFSALAPAVALVLLALYSGALGVNLARGRRDLDCGCLGPAHRQPISPGLLWRNAVISLGAVLLFVEPQPRVMNWIDALSVMGASATLVLLWTAAHQLAAAGSTHLAAEGTT
jgi:hypothetical protein